MVSLKFQAAEENGGGGGARITSKTTKLSPSSPQRTISEYDGSSSILLRNNQSEKIRKTEPWSYYLLYGVVGHRRMHAAQCSAAEAAVGKKKGEEKGKDSLVEFAHLDQLLV